MVNIVLFEPEKPANVGNIMRTCKALDARLIIVGYLTFDLSDKSLKRAGMDYLIGLDVERISNLDEFFKKYGDKNIYYVTRYSSLIYSDADYSSTKEDLFLMFGRESTGIPHDILRKYYSKTVRIPMTSDSRSLNLSNSVAILLAEVKRQQHFDGLSTSEVIKGENFLFEENN
jgi:tRNA (cytidine/uridine-2'-O-)-methyltransferase